MERYSEYKDSGVQSLGEIPGHWNCVPLKYFIETKSGSAISPNELDDNGQYPVYGGGALVGYCNKYNCCNNNIIVGRVGAKCGCVTYPQRKVWATDNALIISSKLDSKFTSLVLEAADLNSLNAANAQPLITGTKIKQVRVALPPLSEQQSIVSYLDTKCAMLDKMLEGKQKQMELLQEMKQRMIADAVTRGLNPNVKMKKSGIFWIPEIPEGWVVRRLGHILHKENRERPRNAELLICTNKAKVIKRGESKMGLVADSEDIYQGVQQGDLLIHGMDTWHGAIAVSEFDGMCTPVVHVCTSKEEAEYISLYLRYMALMKVFKLISNGVRQNTSDFRSWAKVAIIPCPVPPLDEQHSIVSYIQERTAKIDTLTSKLQQQVETIKEYKQRLISDVVTGQIKVC